MAAGQLGPAISDRSWSGLRGVPVLLYHGVARTEEKSFGARERKYCVSLPQFQQQLSLIRQAARPVALLRELWHSPASVAGEKSPVVLTFDDGRSSDYEVTFPALLEAGMRGDFFVNTATVGQPGHLDWRQIAEMQHLGMAFHSHSHDHVDLSRLSERGLRSQLGESKRRLEDRLGRPVEFLAVPYGLVNRRVVRVARHLGYRAVCTSWSWPAQSGAVRVGRVAIHRHTGAREFCALLAGDPLCYAIRAARSALLYVPKQLLLLCRPAQLGVRVLEEQA